MTGAGPPPRETADPQVRRAGEIAAARHTDRTGHPSAYSFTLDAEASVWEGGYRRITLISGTVHGTCPDCKKGGQVAFEGGSATIRVFGPTTPPVAPEDF